MDKKAKVFSQSKKASFRPILGLVGLVIICIVFVSIFIKANKGDIDSINGFGAYKKVKARNGKISIPIKDFNDYKAKYYQYKFPEKTVYFFAVKASDGEVRAAFDACDVCFRSKKGYSQKDNVMVCNNCGQAFPINRINFERGGCNPAPIKRIISGKELIINVSDLYSGLKYF